MEEGGVKGGRGGTVFKILIYICLNCKIILEYKTGGSSWRAHTKGGSSRTTRGCSGGRGGDGGYTGMEQKVVRGELLINYNILRGRRLKFVCVSKSSCTF